MRDIAFKYFKRVHGVRAYSSMLFLLLIVSVLILLISNYYSYKELRNNEYVLAYINKENSIDSLRQANISISSCSHFQSEERCLLIVTSDNYGEVIKKLDCLGFRYLTYSSTQELENKIMVFRILFTGGIVVLVLMLLLIKLLIDRQNRKIAKVLFVLYSLGASKKNIVRFNLAFMNFIFIGLYILSNLFWIIIFASFNLWEYYKSNFWYIHLDVFALVLLMYFIYLYSLIKSVNGLHKNR